MTTTHDLPTVVGWWRGRDIEWRQELSLFPSPERADEERERRVKDRDALWSAMRESGAAEDGGNAAPAPDDTDAVLDAAFAHTGSAACRLAILPLEDVLGLAEQPNLPGTVEGHPNWRRRLPGDAGALLDDTRVSRRLEMLARARPRGGDDA